MLTEEISIYTNYKLQNLNDFLIFLLYRYIMLSDKIKSLVISATMLANVGCATVPQKNVDAEPDVGDSQTNTLMASEPNEQSSSIDVNSDPLIVEYEPYSVITKYNFFALMTNIFDDLTIEISSKRDDIAYEDINRVLNPKIADDLVNTTFSILEESQKLKDGLIDFSVVENNCKVFFDKMEKDFDITLSEGIRDVSAHYQNDFPNEKSHIFVIKDYSHLPDMSDSKEIKDIIAKYNNIGEKIILATPDQYPEVLEAVVEITNATNEYYGTDYPIPPVFVVGENIVASAAYVADGDCILINENVVKFSNEEKILSVLAHEISGHRDQELTHSNKRSEHFEDLFNGWKEDCIIIEREAVDDRWSTALKNTGGNSMSNVLNSMGDTKEEVYDYLESSISIGKKCANSVAEHIDEYSEWSKETEITSDLSAADIGYGKGLIEFFEEQANFYGDKENTPDGKLTTHPNNMERANTIEKYIHTKMKGILNEDNPFDKVCTDIKEDGVYSDTEKPSPIHGIPPNTNSFSK